MNFHAKSEVCSSKNVIDMSTLYFCTFLHLYFVRTVNTKFYAKSGVSISKNERVMLNLVFQIVTFSIARYLPFTPQNIAIDQGINLKSSPHLLG